MRSPASFIERLRLRMIEHVDSVATEPSGRPLLRALITSALFVGGIVIALVRLPVRSWNVFWAEDAIVFTRGALTEGPEVVLQPYSGYLHLVPRLLAEIAVLFPLEVMPAVVTVLSAVALSAVACGVFLCLAPAVASWPLRLGCWAVVIASPIAGGEVIGNLANLHWYLVVAALVVSVAPSGFDSRALMLTRGALVGAAVASDPTALVVVPLMMVRAWAVRRPRETVPAAVAIGAGLLQAGAVIVGTVLAGERRVSRTGPAVGQLFDFYSTHVALPGLLGVTGGSRAVLTLPPLGPGLIALAMFASALLLWRRAGPRSATSILLAVASLGFAGLAFSLQWEWIESAAPGELLLGSRYCVVPAILLVIALLIAVDGRLGRWRSSLTGGRTAVGVVVLLLVIVPSAVDIRVWNVRADATSWSSAVAAAVISCDGEPRRAAILPVKPDFLDLSLPCGVVGESVAAH